MLKKIYSILRLLLNFIIRRRRYVLSFSAEANGPVKRWYYDFKHWGFAHGNLEMVAGADMLCEEFSYDGLHTTVEVIATETDTIGLHVETPTAEMMLCRKLNEEMGYTVFEGEEFPEDWG